MPFLRDFSRRIRQPWHRRQAERQLAAFHSLSPSVDDAVDRALDLGTLGNFKIGTQQVPQEIRWLSRRVAELQPRTVLEIGTARGGTLFIWAQIASRLAVSCDVVPPGVRREVLESFPPPGSQCRVVLLTGNSHEPAFRERVVRTLDGEAVDFLFIDGDHTEAGVEADFEDYRGLVRSGGLVAFHDIAERQALESNQVQHFWRRLRGRMPVEECIADPGQVGYGIGLVRVP
ncbi:MAG TPA: class I SAM-dependent methyltransferase [Anaeromyxobacteraceae bacterium]|nr:class I SAM-dependent methyltransferase [Anaeromyxobacteraceae bacterium]